MTSCGGGGSAVRSPRWQCMEPDQLSGWKLRSDGHVWVGDGSHEGSLWSKRFDLRRPPDEKQTISAFRMVFGSIECCNR